MKITFSFLILTFCFFTFSCTNYEQAAWEDIQNVRQTLPGTWRITSVEINPNDSYYTRQAGVTESMTLEDYGIIEISEFSREEDIATISYEHQGEQFNSYATDIYSIGGEKTWLYLRTDHTESNWKSKFGQFLNNLFFLNENYRLIIVNENRLELIEELRAINKIVLER